VRFLTKHAAAEYAQDLIRVNSIHPGLIATPMNANSTPERIRMLEDKIPLKRRGKPEEVAYCVLYLASDESSFTTGTEFVIDGGFTAQ
jgi:cyclopentanol dehydrogenase